MSLFDALSIAATGLSTTQAAISVVSENVANAQNTGYVDRTAVLAEAASSGGVELAGIQRASDQALQQQLLAQNGQASGDAALNALFQQVEDVTGGSSGTPALSGAMSQFTTAWQTYEASPEDASARQGVITAATSMTQALGSTADGIEQLATTAKTNVGNGVSTLNQDLSQIAELNQQIVTAQANGAPDPDLEDQRDAAVASISKLVSISTVTRPDGSMSVFTPNGLALVDKSAASLSWDGTNITLSGSSTSLNSSFTSGSIGATLGFLRTDSAAVQSSDPGVGALQKMRDQLDAFAQSFYDTAASPAPAFEAAYDSGQTQSGELASSFFTTSDGSATANRFNLVVNPALLNGRAQIKQASATPVVQALTATNQSLNAGGLSVSGLTYAQIANAITARASTNAGTIATNATNSAATGTALSSRLASETGVNIDGELTNLIVLQNSYSAAARVVTTVNSMLTTLMSIGQ
ncbi:MAG: flagellar hook-associated protein FlgK [Alphaproteobacteria bacterium]|nr:flagellar hook-associated protein FlgK [Alphaproteobacteria bacterium]